MHLDIDLTALILWVTEKDGHPMTATDIAFLLDVPQNEADRSLTQLVADGSIRREGNLFRLSRSLSRSDEARIRRLQEQLEQLRPIVEMIPVRLDN